MAVRNLQYRDPSGGKGLGGKRRRERTVHPKTFGVKPVGLNDKRISNIWNMARRQIETRMHCAISSTGEFDLFNKAEFEILEFRIQFQKNCLLGSLRTGYNQFLRRIQILFAGNFRTWP